MIYSRRLPVGCSLFVRPIDFIDIKHPLDFSCRAYFDDTGVSHVTGTVCVINMEIPVPATLGGGAHDTIPVPLRIMFCDVVIIFHFLVCKFSCFSRNPVKFVFPFHAPAIRTPNLFVFLRSAGVNIVLAQFIIRRILTP